MRRQLQPFGRRRNAQLHMHRRHRVDAKSMLRDNGRPETTLFPTLDLETYNDARIVAPGYDVYYLEQEWRNFWFESGKPELKNPDAAFIGFCKSRHNKNPMK